MISASSVCFHASGRFCSHRAGYLLFHTETHTQTEADSRSDALEPPAHPEVGVSLRSCSA